MGDAMLEHAMGLAWKIEGCSAKQAISEI